jgi:putative transposase
MINKDSELPIVKRCELLSLPRSTRYYSPVCVSHETLMLTAAIDEIHTRRPFLGSRRMIDELEEKGFFVNRKRVQRLMGLMGIAALYQKPRTSRPGVGPGHKIYPYLLNDVEVVRANQCWVSDITFIPMAAGFAYLVAVMDLYSRKILSWRLSNTMDTRFCTEALQEALDTHGKPEIFNTDQGSQFTSFAFTSMLQAHDIKISMDGKGRWIDNVFIERFWRSIKYEEVYLHAYEDVRNARNGIESYMQYYNEERRHTSLDKLMPDQAYNQSMISQHNRPVIQPSGSITSRPCS